MEEKQVGEKKKRKRGRAKKRTNLATERTILANERTLMAFARTAFAMVVAGLSILEFFDRARYRWLGLSLIPLGLFVAIVGIWRYFKKRKIIKQNSLSSFEENYEEEK